MLHRSTAFAILACLGLAGAAQAQVTVFSGSDSQASECSLAARHGNANPATIATCTVAIEHEALTGRDLAGTHVNRGVLYLRQQDYGLAAHDFDDALAIDPTLGEALVNRGAVKIAQRHWAEGVADIDRGLAFAPEQPEKAYYNRALAKEHLDDTKGAYFDYRKAADLAPDWPAPTVELKRFNVSEKPLAQRPPTSSPRA